MNSRGQAGTNLPEDAVCVGTLGRPHGVRGEIRLVPESGDPARLVGVDTLWVVKDGEARRCRVRGARIHGRALLVVLEGVDDRDEVAGLTHAEAWARRGELPPPGPDEFDPDEVIGLDLVDGDRSVGRVVAVVRVGARDYFEVDVAATGARALVPAVKDWLVEMDARTRRLVMRLPQGLLE